MQGLVGICSSPAPSLIVIFIFLPFLHNSVVDYFCLHVLAPLSAEPHYV